MIDQGIKSTPSVLETLEVKCEELGFSMPSDNLAGSLLRTLVASKPSGRFLELGTGIGISLSWMADGLDEYGQLISIDNNPQLTEIVSHVFSPDSRVEIICQEGEEWIEKYEGDQFDLIFADTWPGKYNSLEKTLSMVKVGGFYIIDDMNKQPNWPEGHAEKAMHLIATLESKQNFQMTKMNWSTGLILMTKIH